MKTYFANKIHTRDGFNQYVVAQESLILENIRIELGDKITLYFAEMLIYPSKKQYLFAKFGKFVGFIQYKEDDGLYMSLSEFKDLEDVINLHFNFTNNNWNPKQIQEFTKVAYEVFNTDSEDCEIILMPVEKELGQSKEKTD